MIRQRIVDRAADLIVAALVGGWWSPILGVLMLAAIGYVGGLWAVLGMAAFGVGMALWVVWPERWRLR